MFPIRCVVECVNENDCVKCSERGALIADSFAIVAGQTPLSQLVETVLTALGLQHLAIGAKAWIQLKNWKSLSFDQITDDPDVEIECLLKDVSNQLTLRIMTKQTDTAMLDYARDMKDRLLKVAMQKMPKLLQEASTFYPPLKDLITNLVQGDGTAALVDAEHMNQFNAWLEELSKSNSGAAPNGAIAFSSPSSSQQNGPRRPAITSSQDGYCPTPGATRFSPLLELPKLERWLRENPNPSRQRLQYYLQILNGSNFRKHAGKITYQQICNWFSNARASQRKKDNETGRQRNADSIMADVEGRPSSSGSGNVGNHWVGKVFSNHVRNLSIAFNDFIQSAPPKVARSDGVVTLNLANGNEAPTVSGNANHGQQSNAGGGTNTPSAETSSTGSQSPGTRDVTINVIGEEAIPVICMEEEDEEGEKRMRIVEKSPAHSPAINAVIKAAIHDGLPSMAIPNRLSNVSSSSNTSSHASSSASSSAAAAAAAGLNRTRLMFDPLTELPMLEKWFEENPHPSWAQVDQYTEQLNSLSYRQTYPPVSAHNLKIWFKNRRAKCKRLLTGNANGEGGVAAITVKTENI